MTLNALSLLIPMLLPFLLCSQLCCSRVCRFSLLPNQPAGSLPVGFNSGQCLELVHPMDTYSLNLPKGKIKECNEMGIIQEIDHVKR